MPDSWFDVEVRPGRRDAAISALVQARVVDQLELWPHRAAITRLLREHARRANDAQLDSALLPEWYAPEVDGVRRALPQATHRVEAVIPRGTRVYEVPAGPQVGKGIPPLPDPQVVAGIPHSHLDGGGAQVFIHEVDEKWLVRGVRPWGPSADAETGE